MQSDKLYDKRTVARNMKKNLVSQKDYDKFKTGQDDSSDKLEVIDLENDLDEMPRAEEYKE